MIGNSQQLESVTEEGQQLEPASVEVEQQLEPAVLEVEQMASKEDSRQMDAAAVEEIVQQIDSAPEEVGQRLELVSLEVGHKLDPVSVKIEEKLESPAVEIVQQLESVATEVGQLESKEEQQQLESAEVVTSQKFESKCSVTDVAVENSQPLYQSVTVAVGSSQPFASSVSIAVGNSQPLTLVSVAVGNSEPIEYEISNQFEDPKPIETSQISEIAADAINETVENTINEVGLDLPMENENEDTTEDQQLSQNEANSIDDDQNMYYSSPPPTLPASTSQTPQNSEGSLPKRRRVLGEIQQVPAPKINTSLPKTIATKTQQNCDGLRFVPGSSDCVINMGGVPSSKSKVNVFKVMDNSESDTFNDDHDYSLRPNLTHAAIRLQPGPNIRVGLSRSNRIPSLHPKRRSNARTD